MPYTTYVMLNTIYTTVKGTQATCTKCDSLQVITKFSCTNPIPYDKVSTMKGDAVTVNNLVGRFTCSVLCTLTKFTKANTRLVQTSIPKAYRFALG